MKKTFLIISLLFLSVGFCQQIIHTETYDNGSLKSITYFNKTQYYGILFVKHEEYDENGYLDYEQIYKDGKRWDGKWTEWYENGQKRYERTYKDGKEDGKWTEWYSDGKKQYEGTYKGGRKNGIWTYWYENGEKIFKGTYLNGKENGSWHWWYNNGKKRLQGSFSNGEKTGEWLFFSTNDEPMSYNQEFSTKIYSSDGRMLDKLFNESKDLNPINSRNDEKNNHNIQGFVEYVRNSLRNKDLNIYRYGYNIHTSLDFRLQQIAEDAVYKSVIANQQKLNQRLFNDEEEFSKLAYLGIYPEDTVKLMMAGEMELYEDLRDKLLVQSSFVALDIRTGAILAMVGGRPDYPDQFNRATQSLRQPGSVFKPFVYTTAIDNGVPVTRQLLNQPVVLNVRNADGEWVKWMPKNYDGSSGGLTTIREGLRRSLNLISVRMVQEVVPAEEVKQTARRMGISTDIRAVDAIALGTSEVHLLEIVAAYGTFANKGVYCKPFGITRIEDRFGNVLKEYNPRREEVLSAETSYMMTSLLQTVLDRGTGGSARWKYHFYHPAAGKTGTTQGWTDAWFVGYSPYIAAGAWFGVDDPQVSLGKGLDGSKAALPAWARFMRDSHDSLSYARKEFVQPERIENVKICQVTKHIPLDLCPLETEMFIKGTEPNQRCSVHKN